MKLKRSILTAVLFTGLAVGALNGRADEKNQQTDKKAKPYPLAKCIVSDEKFEGSEMKPYEFVHEGQTIKLCCKNCLKDFKKEPAKYLKKMEQEAKKQKK